MSRKPGTPQKSPLMNFSRLRIYLKTLVCFFCMDFLWLSYVSPSFYRAHIDHLLAPQTNLPAALAFYLIFIGGMVHFGIGPALEFQSRLKTFAQGAAFGFVTYATFDLTSQAVFRDWPTIVTLVDLAWGSTLSGATTFVVCWSEGKRHKNQK